MCGWSEYQQFVSQVTHGSLYARFVWVLNYTGCLFTSVCVCVCVCVCADVCVLVLRTWVLQLFDVCVCVCARVCSFVCVRACVAHLGAPVV